MLSTTMSIIRMHAKLQLTVSWVNPRHTCMKLLHMFICEHMMVLVVVRHCIR